MIELNAFEVKVDPKEHLIFLKEELIFSVPDCVFVIVFDDFFVVQVTQDQLVDSVVMIHVDFFVPFHHLVWLKDVLYYKLDLGNVQRFRYDTLLGFLFVWSQFKFAQEF